MKKFGLIAALGAGLIFTLTACGEEEYKEEEYKLSVVAPQGAPAASLAFIAKEKNENYSFISANNISEQFTSKENDFIVAPVNAGAMLYKNGKSNYKLAAVVTWGNLYFATQRADISSINDLAGKNIVLFGETTINSSLAKYVLAENQIVPTYEYETTAERTKDLLHDDANAIVMTAEPALTAISAKLKQEGKNVTSFSISEIYSEISDAEYTQAGLFVKQDTIDNHKALVDNFINNVSNSCDAIRDDLEGVANTIIELNNTGLPAALPVLKQALPKCNIKFKSAADSKSAVEKTANIDLSKFGGAVPSDDFYYNK